MLISGDVVDLGLMAFRSTFCSHEQRLAELLDDHQSFVGDHEIEHGDACTQNAGYVKIRLTAHS